MSVRYIIVAALLLGTSFGLVLLPDKGARIPLKPEETLYEINNQARFLSPHFVARHIIEDDPGLFLVDVRSEMEFAEYNIPGSVNIPLTDLLNSKWEPYLDQEGMKIVFYSNGDLYADQAWMLGTLKGYTNLYIMEGGLNDWFNIIIQPKLPPETASIEAFERYSFAKAASIYFGGTPSGATAIPVAKKKVTVRRKEKKAAEGGC